MGEIFSNPLEVSTRFLNAEPGLQSRDCAPPARTALTFLPYRFARRQIGNERSPQFDFTVTRVDRPVRNRTGHDSDNRVWFIVDPNALSENQRVAMKPSLPEVVA